jgi:hypothetical protein
VQQEKTQQQEAEPMISGIENLQAVASLSDSVVDGWLAAETYEEPPPTCESGGEDLASLIDRPELPSLRWLKQAHGQA